MTDDKNISSQDHGMSDNNPPNDLVTSNPDESNKSTPALSESKEHLSESEEPIAENDPLQEDSISKLKGDVLIVDSSHSDLRTELTQFLDQQDNVIHLYDPSKEQYNLRERRLKFHNLKLVIVILDGNDFVYSRQDKPANAHLRAKQDVVFELGFWVGHLGRERVVALHYHQRSFRNPTNYTNAIFIPMDSHGAWKKEIFSRL